MSKMIVQLGMDVSDPATNIDRLGTGGRWMHFFNKLKEILGLCAREEIDLKS